MCVLVTGYTGCLKSQVSVFLFLELGRFDPVILVTGVTICLDVGAGEFIAGEIVIKFFGIKSDNFKVAAMMIAMTGKAIFALHFCRRMEAFFLVYTCFDFLMTVKTFLV